MGSAGLFLNGLTFSGVPATMVDWSWAATGSWMADGSLQVAAADWRQRQTLTLEAAGRCYPGYADLRFVVSFAS